MCFWAPKEAGEERERGGIARWYYTHHQHWLCPPVMHLTPFFSGRELDDLPVISSIINICLLVKVGCRVYNPLHTHRFASQGFPYSLGFTWKSLHSCHFLHIISEVLFWLCLSFNLNNTSVPVSMPWQCLFKFALKMTLDHFNRVMNMKCWMRLCCICPITPSLIWT